VLETPAVWSREARFLSYHSPRGRSEELEEAQDG
jgi:hypothetical protein